MRVTLKITTICTGVVGTLLLTAVTITPQDADSNIAAWLKLLGWHNPPGGLVTSHADQVVFWIGIAFLLLCLVGAIEWAFGWRRRRIKVDPTVETFQQSDIGARVVIESTIFEPDPADATRRVIKVGVKNMGPGPAYSGFCASSYVFRDGMDEYADIDGNLAILLDYVQSASLKKAVSDEIGQTSSFQMNDRIAEDAWQDVIHGRANLYIWTAYAYLDDKTIGDDIRVAHRVMRYHSGNGDGMAGTLIHQATRTLIAKKQ